MVKVLRFSEGVFFWHAGKFSLHGVTHRFGNLLPDLLGSATRPAVSDITFNWQTIKEKHLAVGKQQTECDWGCVVRRRSGTAQCCCVSGDSETANFLICVSRTEGRKPVRKVNTAAWKYLVRRAAGQRGNDTRLDKSAQWTGSWLVLLAKYCQGGSSDARDKCGMEEKYRHAVGGEGRTWKKKKLGRTWRRWNNNIKWVLK